MQQSNGHMENLIELAHELIKRLEAERDIYLKRNYMMTLVYIEDVLDKYGRGSSWIGSDESHRKAIVSHLDYIRSVVSNYAKTAEFQEVKQSRIEQFTKRWSN